MAERSSSAATSTPKTSLPCRPDWPGLASGLLFAVVTFAVYQRTFSVPLLWDDNPSIAQNPTIRHLWPLWPVLSPPNAAGVGGRPLLNFSRWRRLPRRSSRPASEDGRPLGFGGRALGFAGA